MPVKAIVLHKMLVVDETRCHACQSCMVACSLVHEGQVIPSLACVQVQFDPFTGRQRILHCRQCKRAACARACPHGAIQLVEQGGYWALDESLCDGCGACVQACPFHAMIWSPADHRALKCDTCQGDPACVASCPNHALTWGDK